MSSTNGSLEPRHIQDMDSAASLEPHWGYAMRVVPCTNDPGSCEYLDVVYGSHDVGMIYTGVIWLTLAAIIFIWALYYRSSRARYSAVSAPAAAPGGLGKLRRAAAAGLRRFLLPDASRLVFGRTTRLQVVLLGALWAYITIFTFVGITYNMWITPVKNMPGVYNTRSSLGPWSDRIGVLAYALTPLSIMLCNRESLLSLLTGVPYQSFNFMHRWLGYIIFVQSALHTIGWCVIEVRLYQPQPTVAVEWITQEYMVWGIVAMILLTFLVILSTPWAIRLTGYEFFRKAHYVIAMVYIGACWGHWEQLKCFLLPSLLFWFLDRGARLIRTALLHYGHLPGGGMGFRPAQATMARFPDADYGDVIRLEFEMNQDPWIIGQHYYLCFTEGSVWQSHPFTPLNAPKVEKGKVRHSYILRAKGGETKKVADLVAKKLESSASAVTPIIATGAYGENIMEEINNDTNIICVAGGTGITYVLPVLLELARSPLSRDRKLELIWAVRHTRDVEWIKEEMEILQKAKVALNLTIRIFATRDSSASKMSLSDDEKTSVAGDKKVATDKVDEIEVPSSAASTQAAEVCDCGEDAPVKKTGAGASDEQRHPDLAKLVADFVGGTIRGPTSVIASGPGGMISDLRRIVAASNSGGKVWKGEERADVRLICDDRLEW
ncbi:ferric reductase like transmembrane component-domain-containing protein [Stachybotrys elegans]|uniref:Ferric reductase like transmembrane component-domain-containing protein n=1 Tax=Stachybotrys elegans TaxID=80388 RepID=A0A8K0SP33_9HYPO|nr:ferric reductase like transmembrane component-domain-containing protein [Stachybotrys elegans]